MGLTLRGETSIRRSPMGDVISILFSIAIYALLIFYVPACEAV